ncbi:MAG: glutaredoxin family protein [Candidatus Bathyarchaeia archaeon]
MAREVTVYGTSSCPWCEVTREFLRNHSIPFQDLNVEEDEEAAKEMFRKSGGFLVPVIDIDGTIIVGFKRKKLSEALGLESE